MGHEKIARYDNRRSYGYFIMEHHGLKFRSKRVLQPKTLVKHARSQIVPSLHAVAVPDCDGGATITHFNHDNEERRD